MKSNLEFFHVLEKIILRGKKINKSILTENEAKEYALKRKKIIYQKPKEHILSKSLMDKCYNLFLSFKPSRHIYNSSQRRTVKLIRQETVANILMGLQARYASIEIYNKVYRESKMQEKTLSIIGSSRELFYHNGAYLKNIKKAKVQFEDCALEIEKLKYEVQAEWYYVEIGYHLKTEGTAAINFKEQGKHYLEILKNIPQKYKSSRFYTHYYLLSKAVFEFSHEYEELVEILLDGIEMYDKNYPNKIFQRMLLRHSLITYAIKTEKFDLCKMYLDQSLEMSPKHNKSWLRGMELQTIFLIRTNKIQQAIGSINTLSESKLYKNISREYKLRIELLNNYLLVYSKFLKFSSSKNKEVKLGKYLNSIPEYNADKKAMNIPIIVLQILYYILKKDDNKLEERFDAVNKYLSRYLKSDNFYRSHCFIRMLLQVHRQNFHSVAIERHTKKITDKLSLVSLKDSKEPLEIEIIRYEDLWESVLKYCGKS